MVSVFQLELNININKHDLTLHLDINTVSKYSSKTAVLIFICEFKKRV